MLDNILAGPETLPNIPLNVKRDLKESAMDGINSEIHTPKNPDVFVSIYGGDYYKKTDHLSTIQHGAYFLLILSAWHHDGRLPLNEDYLRRITKMEKGEWKRSRETLLAFFEERNGWYRNKRIDEEIAKAKINIEQKAIAGRASVAARTKARLKAQSIENIENEVNGCSIAVPSAKERPSNTSTSPSTSPSTSNVLSDSTPLIPPPETVPVAKATKKKPQSELPDDWRPSLDGFKLAQSHGLDFEQTFLRFRDYHRSKGNLMASWEAAWGTWCRSPYNKTQGGKPSGLDENTRRLIELGAAQPIPDAFTGPTLDGEMFQ